MQVISIAFNAIFPLFLMMLTGFVLGKAGVLKRDIAEGMSKFAFKILIPCSVFRSIYSADFSADFDLRTGLFIGAGLLLSWLVLDLLVPRFEKQKDCIPVIIQGINKSNYVLLGLSIVQSIYPDGGGMSAMTVGILTPIVNIAAVSAFVKYTEAKQSFSKTLVKILKNPMIVASLLGIFCNLIRLRIPALVMDEVIKPIGSMATPLALLALGATFEFSAFGEYRKQLFWVSAGKLLISPAFFVPLAALLGVRGANLCTVAVAFGAPTAVNSYNTALSMGGNKELANAVVVLTSICSVFTLFAVFCAIGFAVGF